jgi:hypothetical protein
MSNSVGAYVGTSDSPDLGDSRTTSGITWSDRVLEWTDLPADAQAANAGGVVIGEGVQEIQGARRIDGVAHQVRIGWRAWSDLIVVVRVARPLRSRQDGKLTPAGVWFTWASEDYNATAPARHTRSTIPTGWPSADSSDGGATLPREHEAGAHAISFLPSPVRGTLIKAVPDPIVWVGELMRVSSTGSALVEDRVSNCRIGATSAVVLEASRKGLPAVLPVADWTINRRTYELAPSRAALGRGRSGTAHQIGD